MSHHAGGLQHSTAIWGPDGILVRWRFRRESRRHISQQVVNPQVRRAAAGVEDRHDGAVRMWRNTRFTVHCVAHPVGLGVPCRSNQTISDASPLPKSASVPAVETLKCAVPSVRFTAICSAIRNTSPVGRRFVDRMTVPAGCPRLRRADTRCDEHGTRADSLLSSCRSLRRGSRCRRSAAPSTFVAFAVAR